MQSQLLIAQPISNQDQQYTNIGLISPLDFPFNLFLNINQLIDPDVNIVYFFVYSIGQKRIAMWGVYDKRTQSFSIDGACKYSLKELNDAMKQWKNSNFLYTANTVRNRPAELINSYLGTPQLTYSDYLKYKFIIAYFNQLISQNELENRYPNLLSQIYNYIIRTYDVSPNEPEFQDDLSNYISSLVQQVTKYENNINRTDLNNQLLSKLNTNLQQILINITQRFYDSLKYGQLLSDAYYNSLQQCPQISQCQNAYESGCSFYFYGDIDSGYVNPQDPRLLL